MQTMLVEVNSVHALSVLQTLQKKKAIRIVEEAVSESPVFSGSPIALSFFKRWIDDAEAAPTISLDKAKTTWAAKKAQLQNYVR